MYMYARARKGTSAESPYALLLYVTIQGKYLMLCYIVTANFRSSDLHVGKNY